MNTTFKPTNLANFKYDIKRFEVKNIMCYNCFEHFSCDEVWFRCIHPDLTQCQKDKTATLRHVFPLKQKRSWQITLDAPCDKCGKISDERICPKCHDKIPYWGGLIEDYVISIIGGPGSTKSHYFTILMDTIKTKLASKYKFSLMNPYDDEMNKKFETEYLDRIFVQMKKIPPHQARMPKNKFIFLFGIPYKDIRRRKRTKYISLVFHDISGENLSTINSMSTEGKYILYSSAIILLVNPFENRIVQTLVPPPPWFVPKTPNDKLLTNLVGLLQDKRKLPISFAANIPLAICLTMIDEIRSILPDSIIFAPHQHLEGTFDHEDCEKVAHEIKYKLINDWGDGNLVTMAETRFEEVKFFGVSPLGHSPDAQGNIDKNRFHPIRVEDPFLFILSKLAKGIFNNVDDVD